MVRESKENMKTKKKQRQAKPQKKCCSTMNLTKIGDVLAEFGDFQYESFLTGYFSALRVNSTEHTQLAHLYIKLFHESSSYHILKKPPSFTTTIDGYRPSQYRRSTYRFILSISLISNTNPSSSSLAYPRFSNPGAKPIMAPSS